MIHVVRHAPVDAAGLCYGRHDVHVLVAHEEAARRVLAQLDGVRLVAVWASPSERAAGLGRCIAARLALPLRLDARLFELSMGAWEGRLFAAVEREDGDRFRAWMETWRTAAPPGGERLRDLEERVASWHLDATEEEGDVLAVTHAGVIRALRVRARALDFGDALAVPVEHLTVEAIQKA